MSGGSPNGLVLRTIVAEGGAAGKKESAIKKGDSMDEDALLCSATAEGNRLHLQPPPPPPPPESSSLSMEKARIAAERTKFQQERDEWRREKTELKTQLQMALERTQLQKEKDAFRKQLLEAKMQQLAAERALHQQEKEEWLKEKAELKNQLQARQQGSLPKILTQGVAMSPRSPTGGETVNQTRQLPLTVPPTILSVQSSPSPSAASPSSSETQNEANRPAVSEDLEDVEVDDGKDLDQLLRDSWQAQKSRRGCRGGHAKKKQRDQERFNAYWASRSHARGEKPLLDQPKDKNNLSKMNRPVAQS